MNTKTSQKNPLRAFLKSISLFLATLWFVSGSHANSDKPNIILIMADDLGFEAIGANGGESHPTSNLDAMAASGARFTNAFAQPVCTPSRVKIMTGLYNTRNYTKFKDIDPTVTTFAHQLKEAGYTTAMAGKWQLGKEPDKPAILGFDDYTLWRHTNTSRYRTDPETGEEIFVTDPETGESSRVDNRYPNPEIDINGVRTYYDNGEYGPQVMTDYVKNFITENANEPNPFFMYYSMILSHAPFYPTPESDDWDGTSLGSTTYRGDLENHDGYFSEMVAYIDNIVGQISNTLIDLGIEENTLIIFTGDNGTDKRTSTWNGISVKGGKFDMNDHGTRVPLIVSWPKYITSGFVTDELVDFADFLPTMVGAAGANLPDGYTHDGISFLSTLLKQPGRNKDYVYIHNPHHNGMTGTYVRDHDYRWFVSADPDGLQEFSDVRSPYSPQVLDTANLNQEQSDAWERLKTIMADVEATVASGGSFEPPPNEVEVIAIKSGGDEFTAEDGTIFEADNYFENGRANTPEDREIENTADDLLYLSRRLAGKMRYGIPVDNGTYELTLHFAETHFHNKGDRTFDISLEGEIVESNFDVLDQFYADGTAVPENAAFDFVREVTVTDGTLNILLEKTANGTTMLSAIKVERTN